MYFKLYISCACLLSLVGCKNKNEIITVNKDTNVWDRTVTVEEANRIIESNAKKLFSDTSIHIKDFEDVDTNSLEYKTVVKKFKKLNGANEAHVSILNYDSTTKQYYIFKDPIGRGICNFWYYTPSTNKIVNECDLNKK